MIEVLKQMVEALKSATVDCSNFHHAKKDQNHNLGECPPVIRWHHAIEVGKQAIKELESQEPVAWMDADGNVSDNNDHKCFPIPLYTHPPQEQQSCDKRTWERPWVSLTDEEIELIYAECNAWDKFEYERMIEAKLKEKNT